MNINKVTVIGANGTMGCNACAMFASFGNAKVYMISRDIQKSRNTIDKAIKSVRAEAIRKNLIACDYSHLEECIKDSDLIFESVAEDIDIKKAITKQIGEYAKEDTIIATGTSGLSIEELAKVLPNNLQTNYTGMHFFNPPYSMPLLELIPSSKMSNEMVTNLKQYLEDILLRRVIVCKDRPAFVANRIGFQFLNMALLYAEKFARQGGIAYIDSILGPFTGRAMTPCITVDFVGLDVHKAIVDNIRINAKDNHENDFVLPYYVERLISEGKLGRKTGCGLFKTEINEDGRKQKYFYDISLNKYSIVNDMSTEFSKTMISYLNNGDYELAIGFLKNDNSNEAKICREFLDAYINYSLFVGKEVCDDLTYIDDAMAAGFNWCPPLTLSNLLYSTNYPTKYDYRSFFKAVK